MVFEARKLLERFRTVKQYMAYEQRRDALIAIKRETIQQLKYRLEVPHPLCELIAELFGPCCIDVLPPGVSIPSDVFIRAARTEAEAGSPLPLKELSRRLNRELRTCHGELHKKTDYTKQIRTWRKQAKYQAAVRNVIFWMARERGRH